MNRCPSCGITLDFIGIHAGVGGWQRWTQCPRCTTYRIYDLNGDLVGTRSGLLELPKGLPSAPAGKR